MDQICNCSFYWFDLWIQYSQESFTKKTLTPTEHHNIYLMDLSDVLYSSVLPYGFIRYFSDNRHGSLFQPLTPIITPWRTEFFFKAIWWIQALSETEWSEGVLRFCNSVVYAIIALTWENILVYAVQSVYPWNENNKKTTYLLSGK